MNITNAAAANSHAVSPGTILGTAHLLDRFFAL
jgi:hypothetical protein